MKLEDIEQYGSVPEDFWDRPQVRFDDGYGRARAAEFHGWRVVDSWGQGGYNLGCHPYMIVFFRELPAVRDIPAAWEVTVNTEGDVQAYFCPTEEIRIQITNAIALADWQHQGVAWIKGCERIEDSEQLPAELRGPALFEQLRSEIARAAALSPDAWPQGPHWDQCCREVWVDISQVRSLFPEKDQAAWLTLQKQIGYLRYKSLPEENNHDDDEAPADTEWKDDAAWEAQMRDGI